MMDEKRPAIGWIDLLWLVFIVGLALLSPIVEIHKQLTLLAIVVFQILESRMIAAAPKRGPAYAVTIKILLATLLVDHTGSVGINSSYYPVYYLPVVTAALYFRPMAALLWTAVASLAYLSFLVPALQEYELTASGATELAIRILFFFVAGVLVNRFVMENRRQTERYRELSETLADANRQLRHAEAAKRRSEHLAALGQLSAGLAHEIRNPLGVIKGSAEMLRKKVQSTAPLADELAGYISSEVDRANALVTRFLNFAKPSRLQLQPVRIAEIADRALESVRGQFPDAPVRVVRRYDGDAPEILADAQLCEQLFINLIMNAYQAMNGRGGAVTVSISPEDSDGEPGVAVSIEDTGPGIPSELQGQVFNPFFTSKKDGVGLGLSIAAKIAGDHRGRIRLDSRPAHGAHFHVFLPRNLEGAA